MKQLDYDDVAPDASAMIESLRSQGYTLSTAIADLVDNSITATCSNIWIRFEWLDGDSWISITDDGVGMTKSELVAAMRLGSRSPLEERSPIDLGRFGLGLKTASFSQGRRLTVVTKTSDTETVLRRWDLDHLAKPEVTDWQLLRTPHAESSGRYEELNTLDSGTTVLLEVLDRVVRGSSEKNRASHFEDLIARAREHLEMVFHRLLKSSGKSSIRIHINGSEISHWDPFCRNMASTQVCSPDSNNALGQRIDVQGYVLPHRDRFDEVYGTTGAKMHRAAGGPAGWNAHQGFYVYRNKRLIIPGDWLGLGPGRNGWKNEEHYKLARIRVDIPNSMDHDWHIDIKKSSATAPPSISAWLQGLAKSLREEAKRVYAHRGGRRKRVDTGTGQQPPVWRTRIGSGDTFSYRVDRSHPILDALVQSLSTTQRKEIETLLRLIEETVPVQRIWIDTADNQDGVALPYSSFSDKQLRSDILICHRALVSQGMVEKAAWDVIADFSGFDSCSAQAIIGELRTSGAVHG